MRCQTGSTSAAVLNCSVAYSTSSEYVRELIRKDQDRQRLRGLLLAGAASRPTAAADDAYFDGLRQRLRGSRQA